MEGYTQITDFFVSLVYAHYESEFFKTPGSRSRSCKNTMTLSVNGAFVGPISGLGN